MRHCSASLATGHAIGLAALVAIPAVAGCTEVVDVADYAYDDDVCAPAPTECGPGGASLTFVAVRGGMARVDAMGRRDGFDLDATADRICGQPDFVSPRDEPGIDNQGSFLIEAVERSAMIDTWEMNRAEYADGDAVLLIFVDGYDGPDDDCVEVHQLVGYLSAASPAQVPDADGDDVLDAGLTFDYAAVGFTSISACTRGGTVHARFDGRAEFLGGEVSVSRGRFRGELGPEGGVALIGAAVPVESIVGLLPDAATVIRGLADIAPSRRSGRDCTALSTGLSFELVRAERGAPR